mgnify:CR=1 FL=1|jgi:hypothetical protein
MPLVKEISEEKLESIEELFDVRPFYSGQSSIRFFSPNPSGTILDNNYNSNPLPGQTPYDLLSLAFEIGPNPLVADSSNNVNPRAIINTFMSGIVELEVDGGKEQAFVHPIADYVDAECFQYDETSNTVGVGSKELYKIMDPFLVRRNRQFDLTLRWEDTSALPSASDWDSSTQYGDDLAITAKLQVNDYGNNF